MIAKFPRSSVIEESSTLQPCSKSTLATAATMPGRSRPIADTANEDMSGLLEQGVDVVPLDPQGARSGRLDVSMTSSDSTRTSSLMYPECARRPPGPPGARTGSAGRGR
jgi:hypothetical protein